MEDGQRDQRLLVLLFVALIIVIIHGYQFKQRNETVTSSEYTYSWFNVIDFSSFFAIPAAGISYRELFEHFGFSPPENQAEEIFLPSPRESYYLSSFNPPKKIDNDFRSAPLFFLPIPINKTDKDILTTVPGVGERLAEKIIDFRSTIGPYNTLDELRRVDGVGPKKLEILKRYVEL